jgi:hypothetical protein
MACAVYIPCAGSAAADAWRSPSAPEQDPVGDLGGLRATAPAARAGGRWGAVARADKRLFATGTTKRFALCLSGRFVGRITCEHDLYETHRVCRHRVGMANNRIRRCGYQLVARLAEPRYQRLGLCQQTRGESARPCGRGAQSRQESRLDCRDRLLRPGMDG